MDAEHYVRLSDDLANTGHPGVPESDDLEGTRTGLKIGYGQSKWVAEKLLMEAARRGLAVNIVRPGYVVGDSTTAGKAVYFDCPPFDIHPFLQSRTPMTLFGAWLKDASS
jgi:thioester reductase-like protein